jgi:hypothetical protein
MMDGVSKLDTNFDGKYHVVLAIDPPVMPDQPLCCEKGIRTAATFLEPGTCHGAGLTPELAEADARNVRVRIWGARQLAEKKGK